MSKISIKPNDSGTGTFTLESPNSNTDRTLTLPDEAGTVLTSASDVLSSTSDLPAGNLTGDVAAARITDALNATGSAPIYACRAWVNFDGIGTVSIRESGNVSSITDNGTGEYVVNLSVTMPDVNYSVVVSDGVYNSGGWGTNRNLIVGADPISPYYVNNTTTSFQVLGFTTFGSYVDISRLSIAVFR